ncbi:MAG TPA: TOMM precursor leader peptide-binding protein, partial [Anaerolineae bacterium]|nr:TOMM precursor leader peptide-binding protein [Anaerolineae bacterium]
MLTKPKFKDSFHVEVIDAHSVCLLSENAYGILNGRVYANLAPLLTGQHTVTEIVHLLDGKLSPPEVYYGLAQMEAQHYLVEANGSLPIEQTAFWHSLGVDSHLASNRLHRTSVSLTAVGKSDPQPLIQALQQLDIQVVDEGDLMVVCTDDYLRPDLEKINQQAVAAGRPWMLVRLEGSAAWVGPLFKPGATGCWACLAQRLAANRQLESFILRKTGRTGALDMTLAALPSTRLAGANLAATEIVKWILQERNPQVEGKLITFNMLSAEVQSHVLVRRPQCPVCGSPQDYQVLKPIQLESRPKRFTSEAGHRSAIPDETFARYAHHISPITGVVSWLGDSSGEVNGLAYSYSAGHNFAMVQDNLYWLQNNLRSRTGGKGATEIQAKVSAMCEAIERYSAVYRGDELTVRGSYQALAPKGVSLPACLCFSDKQYAQRQLWNNQLTDSPFHIVPNPFNEMQEMDWSPVWSLTHHEFKYMPTAFCYFGHPESRSLFFCAGDSNGTSAGNTLEEAILQGFLELVERDSVALWWYNRVKRPAVDLDSFNLPYLRALTAYYREHQRELWVIDLTSDLQI